MKCKIMGLGEGDAWWPDRFLFEGLEGEMVEDDLFEYNEMTGWANGYFDCEKEVGVDFPTYFAYVRIKKL